VKGLLDPPVLHQPLDSEREASSGLKRRRVVQDVGTQEARRREPADAGWNRIIKQLQMWHRDPAMLDFDDVTTPSRALLWQAVQFARDLRDAGERPYDHVVPTVDGGVAFELRSGDRLWSLEMDPSGESHVTIFENGCMLGRWSLNGGLALSE